MTTSSSICVDSPFSWTQPLLCSAIFLLLIYATHTHIYILTEPHRADATIAAQATGAMSWAFITAMKKNPQQSYVQLLNSIRDELDTKYTQKPQLSCSHPLSTLLVLPLPSGGSLPIFLFHATKANDPLPYHRYEPAVRYVDSLVFGAVRHRLLFVYMGEKTKHTLWKGKGKTWAGMTRHGIFMCNYHFTRFRGQYLMNRCVIYSLILETCCNFFSQV